jgi:hypothetical protein
MRFSRGKFAVDAVRQVFVADLRIHLVAGVKQVDQRTAVGQLDVSLVGELLAVRAQIISQDIQFR